MAEYCVGSLHFPEREPVLKKELSNDFHPHNERGPRKHEWNRLVAELVVNQDEVEVSPHNKKSDVVLRN
jgi:hypothetical protein